MRKWVLWYDKSTGKVTEEPDDEGTWYDVEETDKRIAELEAGQKKANERADEIISCLQSEIVEYRAGLEAARSHMLRGYNKELPYPCYVGCPDCVEVGEGVAPIDALLEKK